MSYIVPLVLAAIAAAIIGFALGRISKEFD